MSLKKYLKNNNLKTHTSSSEEIKDLFNIIERDIKDAQIGELSDDRKFTTAYNAALQLATIVLHSAGYRSSGKGHHWITFKVLPDIMGKKIQEKALFFETCRRKRNTTDYDRAGEISAQDTEDLIDNVSEFKNNVLTWLGKNHPALLETPNER